MKRLVWVSAMAFGLMACDAVDSAVIQRGVAEGPGVGAAPGSACLFKAGGNSVVGIVLDTAVSYRLSLPISVSNTLAIVDRNFGGANFAIEEAAPNQITPLRYEVRWECDATGFASDLGALIVPTFNPKAPFCLNARADTSSDFIGFDFVPVEGGLIDPSSDGVVVARVVPYQLGQAFADTFRVATLADDCCRNSPGCDGQSQTQSCRDLADVFNALDPRKDFNLSVPSQTAGQASPDLARYRGFSVYDGTYMIGVSTENLNSALGATYPLRVRGVLEVATTDGYTLQSNELRCSCPWNEQPFVHWLGNNESSLSRLRG